MASKEHRALLKHPVIASFLWLKWQRIRTFWFSNLILYVAFVVFLTTFIFLRFGGSQLQVNDGNNGNDDDSVYEFNNASKAAVGGLSVVLAVLCIVLVMREAFQMLASFKRYFLSPENIMELAIITLTLVIVFAGDDEGTFEVKRHLAAVCVVLSWMEVLLLIGRHPRSVILLKILIFSYGEASNKSIFSFFFSSFFKYQTISIRSKNPRKSYLEVTGTLYLIQTWVNLGTLQ